MAITTTRKSRSNAAVAERKVEKCAASKDTDRCPEGCDEWEKCVLLTNLYTAGVKAADRAIKRLEKALPLGFVDLGSGSRVFAVREQLEQALKIHYQRLDIYAAALEVMAEKNNPPGRYTHESLSHEISALFTEGK